jgi:hypothetical protein
MKKELNEYLFCEFGFDISEENKCHVSDNWPFELKDVGSIELPNETVFIFLFSYNDISYYASYEQTSFGVRLTTFAQEGIDFLNLKRLYLGNRWIGKQESVNLDMVILDNPEIPSTKERREYIARSTKEILGKSPSKILECLYFKKNKEYLALVQFENENNTHIVGDKIRVRNIPLGGISPWKTLSIGIGKLIEDGKL